MDFRTLHGIEDDVHARCNVDGSAAWFKRRARSTCFAAATCRASKTATPSHCCSLRRTWPRRRYLELMQGYDRLSRKGKCKSFCSFFGRLKLRSTEAEGRKLRLGIPAVLPCPLWRTGFEWVRVLLGGREVEVSVLTVYEDAAHEP
eukprot:362936-Prymnesium_polylepis.1